MINHTELLNQAFQLMSTPNNWDDIQRWYQSLEPEKQILLWTGYTPYLIETAVLHQRADCIKFICDNHLSGVLEYISFTKYQIFNAFLHFQNESLFNLFFECLPIETQRNIQHHFYIQALNALNDQNFILLIKILELSPKHLSQILMFHDGFLIHLSIQNRVLDVFDYVMTYLEEDLLEIIQKNHYSILRHLFTQGNLEFISRIFESFPDSQEEFIRANEFILFELAANFNHLSILKYLINLRPDLKHQMISSNHFHSFSKACSNGHQQIVEHMIECWADHSSPLEILTRENFIAFEWMMGSISEFAVLSYVNLVSEYLVDSARENYRCDVFQNAILKGCHITAHQLLNMYRREKVDITMSLISAFQQNQVHMEFSLFKEIVSIFDDEIIMDSLGLDAFEKLKSEFDARHFQELDFIFGQLQEVKNYRTCLNVLATHSDTKSKYLEGHYLLASIQEFIQSHDKKVLPGFQKILESYPPQHHEAVAFYLNKFIANLDVFPKHFFLKLKDLKPLIDNLIQLTAEPINRFQFLNLNFSVLKLIIEKAPLGIPLLDIKKWQDNYTFLKCLMASLHRNHLELFQSIEFDYENESLKSENAQLLADSLIALQPRIESKLTEIQSQKIKKLIFALRADKDLISLFLSADLVETFESHIWINYQTLINMAKEVIWNDTENDIEHQFMVELVSQKNFHPITVEFLTILPRLCEKLFAQYNTFNICLFEHLLINKSPVLRISPQASERHEQARIWYVVRYDIVNFDYSSYLKLHFLDEMIALLKNEESELAIASQKP